MKVLYNWSGHGRVGMKETRGSSLTRSVTYFTILYSYSAVLVYVLFLYRLSFCLHLTQELEGTARKSAFLDGHPLSIFSSNPLVKSYNPSYLFE